MQGLTEHDTVANDAAEIILRGWPDPDCAFDAIHRVIHAWLLQLTCRWVSRLQLQQVLLPGRWQQDQADRICRRCAMHCIDDEKHLVYECPQMQFIRDAWPELFVRRADFSMKAFFNQKDQHGVFRFVLACLHHHAKGSGNAAENVVICDELPDGFDSD